jgi:hypothetical protein
MSTPSRCSSWELDLVPFARRKSEPCLDAPSQGDSGCRSNDSMARGSVPGRKT